MSVKLHLILSCLVCSLFQLLKILSRIFIELCRLQQRKDKSNDNIHLSQKCFKTIINSVQNVFNAIYRHPEYGGLLQLSKYI